MLRIEKIGIFLKAFEFIFAFFTASSAARAIFPGVSSERDVSAVMVCEGNDASTSPMDRFRAGCRKSLVFGFRQVNKLSELSLDQSDLDACRLQGEAWEDASVCKLLWRERQKGERIFIIFKPI